MYHAETVKGGCTNGHSVSLNLLGSAKGLDEKEARKAKQQGMERIACILILQKYSEWLEEQDFATVFLYESARKMCNQIIEREWYESTGEWSHGKLIAAANKELWSAFQDKTPKPNLESDMWSPHSYKNRQVLDLSVDEYQVLLCLQ